MVNSSTLLTLLASTLSVVYAAPVADTTSSSAAATATANTPIPSGAAGVTFIPWAGPGCDMSTDPFDTTKPEVFNLTSSTGCFTPSYAFDSYLEMANTIAADGPCAVSIFSGPNCTGTVHAATLTTYYDCIVGAEGQGMSVNMACGP